MRVACLLTGPADYAVEVANALAEQASINLIGPAPVLDAYAGDLHPALQVTKMDWPRHRSLRNIALLGRMIYLLRQSKPDVVHFLGDSVVWLTLSLPFLRPVPIIVTVHDVDYHPGDIDTQKIPRLAMRTIRHGAAAIIIHGEKLRSELLRSAPGLPTPVHVIPHPALMRYVKVAERLQIRPARNSGQRRILFFGRVVAYKGLPVFLDAADRLASAFPDSRFIVAGTGPDLDRLLPHLLARPYMEVRAAFVQDAEAVELFVNADMVVLPYVEASQSGVLAIAAAFGRPVVVSDVGELGETVRATGMGLVVPPADPDLLAKAIKAILRNPELAKELSGRAKESAAGALSPRLVAGRTLSVYRSVMDKSV